MTSNIPDELKRLWAERAANPPVVILDDVPDDTPALEVLEDDSSIIAPREFDGNWDAGSDKSSVNNPPVSVMSLMQTAVITGAVKLHGVQHVLTEELDLSSYAYRPNKRSGN
jgi:hypothetical protein